MYRPYRPIYFCRKINIILGHDKDRNCFGNLFRQCEGRVDITIYIAGAFAGQISVTDFMPGRTDAVHTDVVYQKSVHSENAGEGVLWITDLAEAAKTLCMGNVPVLGWLHPGGDPMTGVDYVMESPENIELQYLERIYRRGAGIPWDILETDRCFLRESTVEDVEAFYRIYKPESITRYMENLFPKREQEEEYLRTYIEKVYRYFEFGVWTVIEKATGEIIGRAGLSVRDGYDLPELGFVIGEPWQGRGIAYEICQAILQYGRDEFDFHRFQALVQPQNQISVDLCRKLGFAVQDRIVENQQEYLYLILG